MHCLELAAGIRVMQENWMLDGGRLVGGHTPTLVLIGSFFHSFYLQTFTSDAMTKKKPIFLNTLSQHSPVLAGFPFHLVL